MSGRTLYAISSYDHIEGRDPYRPRDAPPRKSWVDWPSRTVGELVARHDRFIRGGTRPGSPLRTWQVLGGKMCGCAIVTYCPAEPSRAAHKRSGRLRARPTGR